MSTRTAAFAKVFQTLFPWDLAVEAREQVPLSSIGLHDSVARDPQQVHLEMEVVQ